MSFQLSDEQLAVVKSQEKRLMVQAAAGSGKTRVLVERYLHFVQEQGLRPDQILAVTFTVRAAGEMRERIVDSLERAGLREEAQLAETGPIETLHAFCIRILRENPIAAELDPEFSMMNEGDANTLAEDLLRLEIARDHSEEPEIQAFLNAVGGRGAYLQAPSLTRKIMSDVSSVLRQLRGGRLTRATLRDIYASTDAYLNHVLDVIRAHEDEPALKKLIQSFVKALNLPDSNEGRRERAQADVLRGLVILALRVWDDMEREMTRRQSFDFAFVESRAVEMLERSPATRERLRRQFQVALIDEAQDLNPAQYRLIELLGLEWEMLVGDPQQSIYRFRLADVELFRERARQSTVLNLSTNYRSESGILDYVDTVFKGAWSEEYVAMNPRADAKFGRPEAWQVNRKGYTDQMEVAAHIRTLLDEGEQPGDVVLLVRTAGEGKKISAQLDDLGIPNRMLGSKQFYTRLHVRDLANALQALAQPDRDLPLLALLRSPMVALSLDAIAELALNAQDSKTPVNELLEAYRTQNEEDAKRLEEFREWFVPLSQTADRLAAWEVMAALFDRTPYLVRLAEGPGAAQALANVRKLLQQAVGLPAVGAREFARRIRRIQEIRHPEDDAPATDLDAGIVRIMTIHNSKGLEFPVVILPHTFSRSVVPNHQTLFTDMSTGFVAAKLTPDKSVAYELARELEKLHATREEERVLYVAMTRAKRRLCIAFDPNYRANWSNLVHGAIQGEGGEWIFVQRPAGESVE